MRFEFGLAASLEEGVLARSEFIADHERDLDQFKVVAVEKLVTEDGWRHINPAHLCVHADGEVADAEHETTVDGELLGVKVRVGGEADFAAGHNAGTTVFLG